jgi:LacI family transcriptional regulator
MRRHVPAPFGPNSSTPALEVVGIKEIAEALGISIGTVDRALHGRPGINPITRSKVLKTAQAMGYRPNLAARFLKSQKALTMTVHLPKEIAFFFDAVREGIRQAAKPFEPAVRVVFRTYPRLGDGDVELFEQALSDGTHGIVICPGMPSVVRPLIRKAARANVPVVCVATDAPGTERLTTVSACPFTSGAMAGELLCRTVHHRGSFAVFTGSLETEDHAQKVEGFRSSISALTAHREIQAVIETRDDPAAAHARATAVLRKHDSVRGVYVSTANSLPVLQAIRESGLAGRIAVVTTDLFPELVPMIRSGRVLATINQRPLTQGRRAFQALYEFLVASTCPPATIRVAPHLVMQSNLDLFAEPPPPDTEEDTDR